MFFKILNRLTIILKPVEIEEVRQTVKGLPDFWKLCKLGNFTLFLIVILFFMITNKLVIVIQTFDYRENVKRLPYFNIFVRKLCQTKVLFLFS